MRPHASSVSSPLLTIASRLLFAAATRREEANTETVSRQTDTSRYAPVAAPQGWAKERPRKSASNVLDTSSPPLERAPWAGRVGCTGRANRGEEAVEAERLVSGTEILGTGGATVGDFWAWAYSDILTNTSRGIFAEFLVGKALGVVEGVRPTGWNDFDLSYDGVGRSK